MKKYILLSLSIFALMLLSCSKDEEPPIEKERTTQDVLNDFEKIDISINIQDVRLQFRTGEFWDFRVIAPDVQNSEKYPLVINLHGASGGNPDAHKGTACYVEPGFENMEAFIIRPNGGADSWREITNQEKVVFLTNFAKLSWPVDPDKILVTGYSNGGTGSWFYGEVQPDLFSAAIPMASSYTTIHPDGHTRKMPIPMYVIHGEKDELFPVAQTQEWVDKTIAVGSRIKFVIAKDLTHNEPCSYVSYLQDGVKWVQDSVWN